jgi:uncharacterized protein
MRKAVLFGAALTVLAGAPASAAESAQKVVVRRSAVAATTVTGIVRAAELGNARAQATLGFMYEYGRRMPQDFLLAAYWYRRSAEQGNPHGQHLLGLLYNKGRGVREDLVEAYKWLNLAASTAGPRSREYYIRMRDAISSKMDRYQIAEAQRRARHWRPVFERG